MAYLGREPAYGAFERQSITPDGSTTTFTLTYTVASTSSILVAVAGVLQEPNSAYTLASGGTQITFTEAPASSATVFLIYLGIAYEGAIVGQASFTSFNGLAETSADNDRFLVYDLSAQEVKYIESQYLVGITSRTELAERAASDDEFLVYDTSTSEIKKIQTSKLNDIEKLPLIDFAKLDIQGSELTVLKNGNLKLKKCLAIQVEVSYVCLYENQPTFGEVDLWMRESGYTPHRFIDIKRWSITPTIFNNNPRVPGNQLLESDIIYIKDPFKAEFLDEEQLKKLILLSHYCFSARCH